MLFVTISDISALPWLPHILRGRRKVLIETLNWPVKSLALGRCWGTLILEGRNAAIAIGIYVNQSCQ